MESIELKRTLSKIKPELNFYFICWFDPGVHVVEEVQEAKKYCNTNEVVCDHQPDQEAAIVMGRGAFPDQNKKDVECVRLYLLKHGWMPAEEEGKLHLGGYATNAYVTDFSGPLAGTISSVSIVPNTQLKLWKRAKKEYLEQVRPKTGPALDDMLLIVNDLGTSLLNLFGRNYPNQNEGNTPSLLPFVNRRSHYSGFDLESEDKKLFNHLEKLNDYYNNAAKHTDKSKEGMAYSVDKSLVEQFLQTTKEVWLWYGKHKYGGQIPNDQLVEFSDDFYTLE